MRQRGRDQSDTPEGRGREPRGQKRQGGPRGAFRARTAVQTPWPRTSGLETAKRALAFEGPRSRFLATADPRKLAGTPAPGFCGEGPCWSSPSLPRELPVPAM